MSLPSSALEGLERGLPPLRRRRPFFLRNLPYKIQGLRRTREDLRHLLPSGVYISGSETSGFRGSYGDLFLGKFEDEILYTVNYGNLYGPVRADILQVVSGEGASKTVLMGRDSSFVLSTKGKVKQEGNLVCQASIDTHWSHDYERKVYPVALLHPGPKPISEYPVQSIDNVTLDIAYNWSIGNLVFPTLPEGLAIEEMSIRVESGSFTMEGLDYLYPENRLSASWILRNASDEVMESDHWGTSVSVLYEDNLHVSQAQLALSFPKRTLNPGSSIPYSFSFSLPVEWAYGRIAVIHAVNVRRAGNLYYSGGPLFQFEVGKMILP